MKWPPLLCFSHRLHALWLVSYGNRRLKWSGRGGGGLLKDIADVRPEPDYIAQVCTKCALWHGFKFIIDIYRPLKYTEMVHYDY